MENETAKEMRISEAGGKSRRDVTEGKKKKAFKKRGGQPCEMLPPRSRRSPCFGRRVMKTPCRQYTGAAEMCSTCSGAQEGGQGRNCLGQPEKGPLSGFCSVNSGITCNFF